MMDELLNRIRHNLENVNERIQKAAQSAGRRKEKVRLVVVTKAQPVEIMRAAIEAGAQILGENYPEETLPKIMALGRPAGIQWHMIGHLQSRKSGIVAENFDLLHSLDSLRMAERLERQLAERNRIMPVLLEMNVSGEESKYGWPAWNEAQWDSLLGEIEPILLLPHLFLRGLMTMPPLYDDPERTRPFFVRLRKLGDFLASRYGAEHFCDLSMGTSADYPAAVQEGATLVRIGTAIVGPRLKKE
jgi:pyridoxal phosphate enzyme (YggS family)